MKTLIIIFLFLNGAINFAGFAQPKEAAAKIDHTFKIIPTADNTWGYDIYINNKLTIHQPTIPGLPGNQGFKTREAAEKVAELVISKMKKGEMPPTVTEEELEKLNAI